MTYFFDNLKNNFDFFIRKNIRFSRKNYSEKPEDISKYKNDFYYKQLKKYNLSLLEPAKEYNFLLNLYLLNVFDKYFLKSNSDNISILDIGSKNWEYAKSEYLFFSSFCYDYILEGIELDSNRLNSRLFSRFEVAKFHTKNLKNTNYIAGNFLNHNKKYDYMVWILPFITKYPLVRWGLPLKYFMPEKMLIHAYNFLNTNGQLLIINQGESEYEIQKELNSKLKLNCEYFGEIADNYKLFKNKRYCSKITKIS